MKVYVKEEDRTGYKIVIEVDENGKYNFYCEFLVDKDQHVTFDEYQTTIFEMGWTSLQEFLKSRMKGCRVEED